MIRLARLWDLLFYFCFVFFFFTIHSYSHTLETDFYATKSNSLRGLHLIGFFNAVVVVVFVSDALVFTVYSFYFVCCCWCLRHNRYCITVYSTLYCTLCFIFAITPTTSIHSTNNNKNKQILNLHSPIRHRLWQFSEWKKENEIQAFYDFITFHRNQAMHFSSMSNRFLSS